MKQRRNRDNTALWDRRHVKILFLLFFLACFLSHPIIQDKEYKKNNFEMPLQWYSASRLVAAVLTKFPPFEWVTYLWRRVYNPDVTKAILQKKNFNDLRAIYGLCQQSATLLIELQSYWSRCHPFWKKYVKVEWMTTLDTFLKSRKALFDSFTSQRISNCWAWIHLFLMFW